MSKLLDHPAFNKYSTPTFLTAMFMVVVATIYFGKIGTPIKFEIAEGDEVIDMLISLAMIALFLERAQEVFVSAWRDSGKRPLEEDVETLIDILEAADKKDRAEARRALQTGRMALAIYKADTNKISYRFGVVAGLLIALVGVRTIQPLANLEGIKSTQVMWFTFVDVSLTAGLIGGGADGIHKVVATFTDFLQATRDRVGKGGRRAVTK